MSQIQLIACIAFGSFLGTSLMVGCVMAAESLSTHIRKRQQDKARTRR